MKHLPTKFTNLPFLYKYERTLRATKGVGLINRVNLGVFLQIFKFHEGPAACLARELSALRWCSLLLTAALRSFPDLNDSVVNPNVTALRLFPDLDNSVLDPDVTALRLIPVNNSVVNPKVAALRFFSVLDNSVVDPKVASYLPIKFTYRSPAAKITSNPPHPHPAYTLISQISSFFRRILSESLTVKFEMLRY